MRQVLVDRARRKLADKRGGGEAPLSLEGHDVALTASPAELVALDDALAVLAKLDARAASVVELRVFAGMSVEESAHVLEVSERTVKSDWKFAKLWLADALRGADSP